MDDELTALRLCVCELDARREELSFDGRWDL
jgi:hypothetical protein